MLAERGVWTIAVDVSHHAIAETEIDTIPPGSLHIGAACTLLNAEVTDAALHAIMDGPLCNGRGKILASFDVMDVDGVYISPSSWINSVAGTNMRNYIYREKKMSALIDTVENDEIFYLSNGVAEGKMRVQNGCEYVVLEGSILDPKITSNESSIRKSRKEHADSLSEDGMVVIRDITFNTPSGAANFIRGGACNGKTYWRTASDRPLSDFISYS